MMFQVLLAVVFMLGFAGSQGIDPSEIPMPKREYWCNMQTASCPLICHSIYGGSKTPDSNACDPETLSYSCVCASGQPPNATKYTQTIPYYICMQKNRECVKNCNGVQSCQSACRTQNPCGAQHPERVNITTRVTTTAASTSPPTGVVYTGFGATATADPKKDGGSSVTSPIDIGRVYGLFVVMGGILAGFGVLL